MKHTIDATNQSIGRLATQISVLLRGKHLPTFEPHKTTDEIVIIENYDKVKFTGKKLEQKMYHRYTGFPGGIRSQTMEKMQEKYPKRILEMAVYRMLPQNRTRDVLMKRLIIK